MKRTALFVLLATCAHASAPAPVGPPPFNPKEIQATVEQYRQAWDVLSIDALAPLYFASDDLVLVRQGHAWRGWEAVRGGLADLFRQTTKLELVLSNETINQAGDGGAVVTADVHLTWTSNSVITDQQGALTLVLRRGAAGWKIVGEHYSFAS
jgi:ketosteroid isomerase-like protein